MKFKNALRKLFAEFGINILNEERAINILSDYHAFEEHIYYRHILKSIISSSFIQQILNLSLDKSISIEEASNKLFILSHRVSNIYGYNSNHVHRMIDSIHLLIIQNHFNVVVTLGSENFMMNVYGGKLLEKAFEEIRILDTDLICKLNGKNGILGFSGECIIPFVYDEIICIEFEYDDEIKYVCIGYDEKEHKLSSNRVFRVKKGDRYGLLDKNYNFILYAEYEEIKFSDGKDICVRLNGKYGVYNYERGLFIPIDYDCINYVRYKDNVYYVVKDESGVDLLDKNNKSILNHKCHSVEECRVCHEDKNGGEFFYDEGLLINGAVFFGDKLRNYHPDKIENRRLSEFDDGETLFYKGWRINHIMTRDVPSDIRDYYPVWTRRFSKIKEVYGFGYYDILYLAHDCSSTLLLSPDGTLLFKCNSIWEVMEPLDEEFHYLKVCKKESYSNPEYNLIDKDGELVMLESYNDISMVDNMNLFLVKKGSKYGVIDKLGRTDIPCRYDSIEPLTDDLFKVSIDGLYGLIDDSENEILPIKYSDMRICNTDIC